MADKWMFFSYHIRLLYKVYWRSVTHLRCNITLCGASTGDVCVFRLNSLLSSGFVFDCQSRLQRGRQTGEIKGGKRSCAAVKCCLRAVMACVKRSTVSWSLSVYAAVWFVHTWISWTEIIIIKCFYASMFWEQYSGLNHFASVSISCYDGHN